MQQPDQSFDQSTSLYESYAPTVLAYLLRRLDSREDAEDVLLEVFAAVLEKGLMRQKDEVSLYALILTIARNKVVDHYRRSRRFSRVPLASVEECLYESEEREPEQVILRVEEYQQLRVQVQKLPEPYQEILQLRFGENLRCAEIAQVMSRSEKAVRALLYRALKRLRGIYDNEQAERAF